MSTRISPIVPELETEEPSATHDKWFRTQVSASINDPAPNIPHDQVMAEMRALLKSKQITTTDHTEDHITTPPSPRTLPLTG
ncbi:Uncharacterized protein ALO83_03803 [Pseudomonas cannabina pv. alisalensis]|uniref:Stability determinant domain-containing protein n=2 Tax=Pseudomonas cannabina TaxID=86840 RepID=A0A3M3R0W3_PSECA|nr:antitoxin [Pseudomonas cannabina]KPW17059.1 Uncharacterized protein ALO83_03803 [Pseudomonas cannabina pv. alisalensis]MBM0139938.1 antitoxin [Pseudomonas cannabina pv. alisalensis]RMN90162.1 hypothetical protein ALQ51_04787 [Pseudomonas cannabina]